MPLHLNPVDGLGDHIGVLVTLILAAVAFQCIVSQSLPDVSYLTTLDQYTFCVLSMLRTTWSCVLCWYRRHEEVDRMRSSLP